MDWAGHDTQGSYMITPSHLWCCLIYHLASLSACFLSICFTFPFLYACTKQNITSQWRRVFSYDIPRTALLYEERERVTISSLVASGTLHQLESRHSRQKFPNYRRITMEFKTCKGKNYKK